MSLVAYASSDDESQSDKEDEALNNITVSKKKDRVKIVIPSLKEFEEEKPEPSKKLIPKGGSGLFSILPPPKNSSVTSKPGFTPYVFSKKKEIKPKPQIPKQTQNIISKKAEKTKSVDPVDEPEDTSEEVDFFSLNTKPSSNEKAPNPFDIQSNDSEAFDSSRSGTENSLNEVPANDNWFKSTEEDNSAASWNQIFPSSEALMPEASGSSIDWSSSYAATSNANVPPECPEDDDEELLKLTGRKRKEEINFIDVNADDQLTGKDQWIMQSLSQETYRPFKRRHDMPTSQQKRKHQITYLAFQAKERELDLKNQWANNSRTRRETQAKYGF